MPVFGNSYSKKVTECTNTDVLATNLESLNGFINYVCNGCYLISMTVYFCFILTLCVFYNVYPVILKLILVNRDEKKFFVFFQLKIRSLISNIGICSSYNGKKVVSRLNSPHDLIFSIMICLIGFS